MSRRADFWVNLTTPLWLIEAKIIHAMTSVCLSSHSFITSPCEEVHGYDNN